MTLRRQFDLAALATVVALLGVTLVIYLVSTDYFSGVFAREDGLVEYGTAICLFAGSLILLSHAVTLKRGGRGGAAVLMGVYALMFFMAAGEEVSWGQRIFGWESGEFFQENNKQFETNLHNMIIPTPFGDFHLAKTLFGPFLTVTLLLYLAVLPLLYRRGGAIARLADRIVLPVPGIRHAVLAVAASLVIAAIDVSRKWEVYEFVFGLLVVSIFLIPQNRDKLLPVGDAPEQGPADKQ